MVARIIELAVYRAQRTLAQEEMAQRSARADAQAPGAAGHDQSEFHAAGQPGVPRLAHPLKTPSGRIEIFSTALASLGKPDEIPPIPKYIREWESPFGPEARKFPLQVVGFHSLSRVHSTMSGLDWLEEAFPHRLFINPLDAAARKIQSGDRVRVFNERGQLTIVCRVTRRIMPGVVGIPQGAWWTPGPDGVDVGGSVNVLTSERWTPLAFANAQHTVMAEVAKT
jgi:anaerobic dimethyl sulfoxide reductase subunit A